MDNRRRNLRPAVSRQKIATPGGTDDGEGGAVRREAERAYLLWLIPFCRFSGEARQRRARILASLGKRHVGKPATARALCPLGTAGFDGNVIAGLLLGM